jgi:hypothetical protein
LLLEKNEADEILLDARADKVVLCLRPSFLECSNLKRKEA